MPGKLVHVEFPAKDAKRASQFYSQLFGWTFNDSGMPGIEYLMFQDSPPQNFGGATYASDSGDTGPVIYFDTDDIDGTLARVRELGGEAEDKQPIPSVGWFARCKDTEGNPFSLFQSDDSVAMEGHPPAA